MWGLSRWPIEWVIPQIKGCFLGGPSLSHVRNMEWMAFIPLGMEFMTYNGSYCLIYWFLCRVCAIPSFPMHPFSNPFYWHKFFKIQKNWVLQLGNIRLEISITMSLEGRVRESTIWVNKRVYHTCVDPSTSGTFIYVKFVFWRSSIILRETFHFSRDLFAWETRTL